MLTKQQFRKLLDIALLKPEATRGEVERFLKEARSFHFGAVYVYPCWVSLASRGLEGSDVKPASYVGLPYGLTTRRTKIFEAKALVEAGADELDLILNLGHIKSGNFDLVERELSEILEVVKITELTADDKVALVKVVLEIGHLTRQEQEKLCKLAAHMGVDFIKTCSGFDGCRVTPEDIQRLRDIAGPEIGIEAAGQVNSLDLAYALLESGANRLLAENAMEIAEQYEPIVA